MIYQKHQKKIKYQQFSQSDYFPFRHQGFATKAIHEGQEPEPVHGSVNVPIHMSATYAQKDIATFYSKYDYTRCGNPTWEALQTCLASLEYANSVLIFSSGTGATAALMQTLYPGDHILMSEDLYGGTYKYASLFAAEEHGVDVEFTDFTNISIMLSKIKKETKMVWIQTPSNPTLKVIDIQAISTEVKKINQNIKVIVDNTFSSPLICSPLLLGADVSMSSISKYISGHSDIILGLLAFKNEEYMKQIHYILYCIGVNPSPFDCYMALRGLKTLQLRVVQATRNAFHIAHFLEKQQCVELVNYPGLKSSLYYDLARKQMRGFGAMISFAIKGGKQQVSKFLKACKKIIIATSFGGTETLANSPAFMSQASVPENYIRLSVGIEDLDDLIQDIEQALVASQQE